MKHPHLLTPIDVARVENRNRIVIPPPVISRTADDGYIIAAHVTVSRGERGTARKLSEIIWHMLYEEQPFDETRRRNPEIRRKAMDM